MTNTIKEIARELGKQAFLERRSSAPAMDKKLMELIKGLEVGQSGKIFKAFTDGYYREMFSE